MRVNKQWLYYFFLFFIVVTSFVVKFVALNKYEVPPSPDYGNYLTQVDIINGHDLRGYGLQYNPLFFITLNVFLKFFDEFTALKALASLVFSIIAVPFFLLVKKLSNDHVSALIATWLLVFFEGYSEMIAWGGNPNFLGFSFMLLALLFLINALENPSRKNILLAGFFLSLVVGTHFLVTFFVVFSLIIFIFSTWIFNRRKSGEITKVLLASSVVGIVLSLPYFFVYQSFLTHSSNTLVEFNLLTQTSEIPSELLWLFRTHVFTIAIIALLGIFALSRYFKQRKNKGLILSCLFVSPFILALFTIDPGRWFYFLPIPIMLCFGLYLRNLFTVIENARKEIFLLALCFVLVVSVETTAWSINRLETAVDYYQTIGKDEMQAFRWIAENTETNAIFVTSGPNKLVGAVGNCYAWWIEGFSKRKCLPAGPLEYYTFEEQRKEVSIANRFFAGKYVVEGDGIRISENFPASLSNPEIAAYIEGDYQNALFLNDGELDLTFSPIENAEVILHESPFYAETKMVNMYCNETWVNATFTYEWERLRLIRSLIMGQEKSSVNVIFKVYPGNSLLRQLNIHIWGSYHTTLENYEINNSTITLSQKLPFNIPIKTKITLLHTNGAVDDVRVLLKDPKYSMPVATYSLTALQNDLYAEVKLSIITNTQNVNDQPVHFYDSDTLIRNLGVNYIFLNKGRIKEYQRFLSAPNHFIVVFENEGIVVFRVI